MNDETKEVAPGIFKSAGPVLGIPEAEQEAFGVAFDAWIIAEQESIRARFAEAKLRANPPS